jgi:hypothetical protein
MATVKHARTEQASVTVPTDPATPPALVVALSDGEGNLVSGGAGTDAYSLVSAAQAAADTGTSFSTKGFRELTLDINVTAFTGGTTPSITFFLERQGNDGVWYRVWQSAAQSGAAKLPVTIGPGTPTVAAGANVSQGVTAGLTSTARFGWSTTGTPTSVTFSASIVGK